MREKAPYVTKWFSIVDFKAYHAWVSGFKQQYSVVCNTVSGEDRSVDSLTVELWGKNRYSEFFRVNDLITFVTLMRLGCS